MSDENLRPADVAKLLGVPESTLATWRAQHRGPAWGRYPGTRVIFYRRSAVESYQDAGEKAGAA